MRQALFVGSLFQIGLSIWLRRLPPGWYISLSQIVLEIAQAHPVLGCDPIRAKLTLRDEPANRNDIHIQERRDLIRREQRIVSQATVGHPNASLPAYA
jgi:hypothetical protein